MSEESVVDESAVDELVVDESGEHDPVIESTEDVEASESADDATEAEQVTDWSSRIAEWGGEESVADAIALQNALRTREGVEELARQALNALGVGNDKIASLFGSEDATSDVSVDDLLADPDRVLTAAEISKLLDEREAQRLEALSSERMAMEVVRHTNDTFAALGVTDESDKDVLIALADKIIGDGPMDGASIKSAITKAHAQFTERVKANASAIVSAKHTAQAGLPKPLPASGASAGADKLTEPATVAEAIERTRKQLGI